MMTDLETWVVLSMLRTKSVKRRRGKSRSVRGSLDRSVALGRDRLESTAERACASTAL